MSVKVATTVLVKCPKCQQNMKYHTRDGTLSDKRKRCVYCNRSFKIRDRILRVVEK